MNARPWILALSLSVSANAFAQPKETKPANAKAKEEENSTEQESLSEEELFLESMLVTAPTLELERVGGSATVIDEEALETQEYDDVHRVLKQVTGVYTRDEDGSGLRPNIGIRGAYSDRSSKITLMEDGILFGPAPYSAPAAYYFPLSTRMVGIDVYKGPAASRFGPATVGGAINMHTRDIPYSTQGAIDLSFGLFRQGKAHGWAGTQQGPWGILLEGIHLRSDGFKDLDGGGNTGFAKNEFMLKSRYDFANTGPIAHSIEGKAGYADETSHETYMGLTLDDFRDDPYRRYAASQLGLMNWKRGQLELSYTMSVDERFELKTTAYRHDISRAWKKFNSFRGGPNIRDILLNPTGQRAVFLSVLRGEQDSTDNETLLIGTNDRRYVSQGVHSVANWRYIGDLFSHNLNAGLRFHFDRIRRNHTEEGYLMRNGTLVRDNTPVDITLQNRQASYATALNAWDEISIGEQWVITPGARLEVVNTSASAVGTETERDTYLLWTAGLGATFYPIEELGILAGIHRGTSPVAPGQDVTPESSINYELGARLQWDALKAEAIGFFNDYRNLIGQCTFSGGCDDNNVGDQFDGGQLHVYGLEATAAYDWQLPLGLSLGARASYTFTLTRFRNNFTWQHPQFGSVESGDSLPYVPEHQFSSTLGLNHKHWGLQFVINYVGAMRDTASQGSIGEGEGTDPYAIVDASAYYAFTEANRVYITIDNLFDNRYIAGLRPFGARPGKPFSIMAGYKHRFGELD